MTHLSLFSGIGGLDLAAEMAGFTTVGQVEIDDYCNGVLDYHWPEVPRWRDVKDVTAESFEERTGIKPGTLALLSGGFPCQPVSCAGKRKGDTDERWLWDEMLRVICEVRPRWVVAENVRGLLSAQAISDGRKLFGRILRDLAENGYRVGWLCYGAGDVGAPHKRERVFIVAHSRGGGFGEQGICREQQGGAKVISTSESSCRMVAHTPQHLFNRPRQTRETGRGEFADGGAGPTQPRLGNPPDGLPSGLAGHRWPAGWWQTPSVEDAGRTGSEKAWMEYEKDGRTTQCRLRNQIWAHWPAGPGEQHPWEPPRIATGVKDRVAKLKALGNAVVPAQAYPIFRAIAEQMKLFEEATI